MVVDKRCIGCFFFIFLWVVRSICFWCMKIVFFGSIFVFLIVDGICLLDLIVLVRNVFMCNKVLVSLIEVKKLL